LKECPLYQRTLTNGESDDSVGCGSILTGRTQEEIAMLRQVILICIALMAMSYSANPQQSLPNSEKAKQIETLVHKAAVMVEKEGKDAFIEFRKRGSEWWSGDTYLFAYDPNLNVILNPAFPEREGKNMSGDKDKNGKAFHDEFMKVVKSKGSGWVDYWLPKPGQTQPSQKWSYVTAIKIDGGTGIIGAGFYPD
jgi:signal transduction histidine kinase